MKTQTVPHCRLFLLRNTCELSKFRLFPQVRPGNRIHRARDKHAELGPRCGPGVTAFAASLRSLRARGLVTRDAKCPPEKNEPGPRLAPGFTPRSQHRLPAGTARWFWERLHCVFWNVHTCPNLGRDAVAFSVFSILKCPSRSVYSEAVAPGASQHS